MNPTPALTATAAALIFAGTIITCTIELLKRAWRNAMGDQPNGLLGKAYVPTLAVLVLIVAMVVAMLFAPGWVVVCIAGAMGLAVLAFCIWQPNTGGG